ncbi:MAG: type IV secretion system DNA-binding domain-containing protein [bacterium]|nr:type IV secretion system DNA-binding domain-containing protein [bacterium]
MDENKITYLGETDARNQKVPFGIRQKDRSRHVYVIGKTGMGKSTLLENMAVQDIQSGEGMAFIDPHGKTAELLLDFIPEDRIQDVLYFAPFDLDHPISFNVMEDVGPDKRHLVANGLMSAFKKIWVDAWSARMEYILNNILLALLEYPDSTLIGVNRMLADKEYRKRVTSNITDPSVRSFWIDEFAKYGERYMQEAGAAIQNKIGQFISNPLVRNIIGQPKSTFDIRKMMDARKIIIINLSKGRVGEANANLLGSMIITKIYLSAMSRADLHDNESRRLPAFYLYVDEFQSFANESFADILSEARKYKLSLTIAHQYIEQMSEEVRAAVFGNVGTMIAFRVGAYDAEVLEKEYAPVFTAEDMVNLGFIQIYLKLMIDGVTSAPFSAITLPPIRPAIVSFKDKIVAESRRRYAKPRAKVEDDIKRWHEAAAGQEGPRGDDKFAFDRVPKPREKEGERIALRMPDRMPVERRPEKPNEPRPLKPNTAVERESELRKAMSLGHLNKNEPGKEKKPSGENKAGLKEALATLLKKESSFGAVVQEEKQANSVKAPNSNPRPERAAERAAVIPPKDREEVKKEVPKEVLEKVLKVE